VREDDSGGDRFLEKCPLRILVGFGRQPEPKSFRLCNPHSVQRHSDS